MATPRTSPRCRSATTPARTSIRRSTSSRAAPPWTGCRSTHVDAEWLEHADIPRGAARLLFKTRNSELWSDPTRQFTRDFVTINASGARWCVERGVRLVGMDYLSIEPQGPEKAGYPVHHTLLGAGVVIIEGLDLRGISAGEYELVCAPIKIKDGDGAPARVFLIQR